MTMADRERHMPRRWGEYLICKKIGRGGFCKVYQAIHQRTQTPVAIKTISHRKIEMVGRKPFISEILILKHSHHEHIVRLIDCEESATHIYLIMEYCSMGDLAGFIRHGADRYGLRGPAGGLSEHVIRHFLRQLASALRFMHVRNLIHRDIKPQNLLLLPSKKAKHARMALNHNEQNVKSNPTTSPQSQESVTEVLSELPDLKVADFGMARVLGAQEQAETACGTWAYAAPEVMMCKKYDGKADLWSVGVVLYEMCYGRLPFTGQNHPELLRQIHEHADDLEFPDERDLRFPGAARTAISDDLKDLIRQLLRPNPEHRISFTNFFRHPCVVGRPPIVPESIPPIRPLSEPKSEKCSVASALTAIQNGTVPQPYSRHFANNDGPVGRPVKPVNCGPKPAPHAPSTLVKARPPPATVNKLARPHQLATPPQTPPAPRVMVPVQPLRPKSMLANRSPPTAAPPKAIDKQAAIKAMLKELNKINACLANVVLPSPDFVKHLENRKNSLEQKLSALGWREPMSRPV